MKRNIFFAVAALLALAACTKEETTVEKTVSLTASFSDSFSKAVLAENGKTPVWSEGDQININGKVYTVSAAQAGSSSITFEGVPADAEYTAVYPASLVTESGLVLPAEQLSGSNKIAYAPMYAKTTGTTLTFDNVTSVLCLSLTTTQANINVSTIELKADQPLSGHFSVSNLTGAAVFQGSEATKLNCLNGAGEIALSTTPSTVYITIPSGEYTNFAITLYTKDGDKQTRTAPTFKAAKGAFENLSLAFNKMEGGVKAPEGFVDLGLSVFWAKWNLGATAECESIATSTGDYYRFGEVETIYDRSKSTNVFPAANFSAGFPKINDWMKEGMTFKPEAYAELTDIIEKFQKSNSTLTADYDPVTTKLGTGFRTPTKAEADELKANTTAEFFDGSTKKFNETNIPGWKLTSTKAGFETKFIFIPATGWALWTGSSNTVNTWGTTARLMTSTGKGLSGGVYYHYILKFTNTTNFDSVTNWKSECGYCVRPVAPKPAE